MRSLTLEEAKKKITAQRDNLIKYYLFYYGIEFPAPDEETFKRGCGLYNSNPRAYEQEEKEVTKLILETRNNRVETPLRLDIEEKSLRKKKIANSSDCLDKPDTPGEEKIQKTNSFKQKLEERLSSLDKTVVIRTLEVLKNYEVDNRVIPKSERRKLGYEFQEHVIQYFSKIPGCFQGFEVIRNQRFFPKALLKIVAKGVENVENKLPPEFLSCLANIGNEYPLIYFIAGVSRKSGDLDKSLITPLDFNTAVLNYMTLGRGLLLTQHSLGEIKNDYTKESQLPDFLI